MDHHRYDVLCVGILVADLVVPPLAKVPVPGELVKVETLLLSTGGCAANTAVDLARLNGRVAVAGRVGNDVFATFIRQDLEANGVDTAGVRVSPSSPTSRTVILNILGDDRRYIHMVGANAELKAEDIDLERVRQARCLYVGGYGLFPGFGPDALAALFRFARQHGVLTVLDVAGVNAAEGLAPFQVVLPYADAFLPNGDEARLITGEVDPLRQAEHFIACGAGIVVITEGEGGALVRTPHAAWRAGVYQVPVVDPSGAGDAFDAGFILGLLQGWDLPRTLAFASAIGASVCTQLGTTAGVWTLPAALEFVAANPLAIEALATKTADRS
jgi:sugar/nucleoside kinase (ribokinase family)